MVYFNTKRRKVAYLFIDFETVGLNYDDRGNELENEYLEVAGFFKDTLFDTERKYEFTYLRYIENLDKLVDNMVPAVYKMHSESGLLDEVKFCNKNGCALTDYQIERDLLKIVEEYHERGYMIKVVGNSIGFDFELIRRYFPTLYSAVDGRPLDVSAFAQMLRGISTNVYKKVLSFKNWGHRAIDDIKETDLELMRYRKMIDLSSLED